jgi:type VI protein secretion system component VasF
MGEYRDKANGQDTIAKLMDKLYQIIIETRGEAPNGLFIEHAQTVKIKIKRSHKPSNRRWTIGIWAACVVVFLAISLPYRSKLDSLAKPIQHQITGLAQQHQDAP